MLLPFQITALGPTSVGNALEDAFRNAVAPSPRSPDTQHLSWDGGIYVLGFMPSFFYLHAEKSRRAQGGKKDKKNQTKKQIYNC